MREPVRIWVHNMDGRVVMIDASEVVSIVAHKMPGAWRNLPGNRREQGPANYDVTFRFRSGATDRLTLDETSWTGVRGVIEKGATP